MNVSDFDGFLDSLATGLAQLDGSKPVRHIAELRQVLTPFRDQTMTSLCDFLRRCLEYERTGVIPCSTKSKRGKAKGGVPQMSVEQVASEIRGVINNVRSDQMTFDRIDAALETVAGLKTKGDVLAVAERIGIEPNKKDTRKQAENQIRNYVYNQKQAADSTRF